MLGYQVTQGPRTYHLKMSPSAKLLDTKIVLKEIEKAQFASDRGLSPKLVWADAEKQALLTDFVRDESNLIATSMHLGPVLKATVQALAQLHQTETGSPSPWRLSPVDENRQEVVEWIDKASQVSKPIPLNLDSLRTYGTLLFDRMATLPAYQESFLHGDMNGCNTIYTSQKVWFIDWGSSRIGDPMAELANYAVHMHCTMRDMPEIWRIYYASITGSQMMTDNTSIEAHPDFKRAQLHIAINHVRSYAMHAVGMPWHKPECRDDDLAKLARLIQEDATCLSLVNSTTKKEVSVC